jgi:hypothetical protein
MSSRSGTFPVHMKRGGTLPMHVEYTAYYEHEPTGDGWVVEIEAIRFSPRDKKDRDYLLAKDACDILQEDIANDVEGDALENGWHRPRPYSLPYYR